MDLVTTGRPVKAARALSLGLGDAVGSGGLRAEAVVFARHALTQPLPQSVSALPVTSPDAGWWGEQMTAIAKRAKGEVAPLRALDCLCLAAEKPFAEAIAQERATFLELRASDQAAALPVTLIEAVLDDLAVKRAVVAELGRSCRAEAVLATNTAYLDPRLIAEGLPNADRFIALNFFSPANIMKLLKIVPTPETSVETLATGFALARALGKIPVQAGICDGFIGNRIMKRYVTSLSAQAARASRLAVAGRIMCRAQRRSRPALPEPWAWRARRSCGRASR